MPKMPTIASVRRLAEAQNLTLDRRRVRDPDAVDCGVGWRLVTRSRIVLIGDRSRASVEEY